jgi:hypothetical protein
MSQDAHATLLRHKRQLAIANRDRLPLDHPLREKYDAYIKQLRGELLQLGITP